MKFHFVPSYSPTHYSNGTESLLPDKVQHLEQNMTHLPGSIRNTKLRKKEEKNNEEVWPQNLSRSLVSFGVGKQKFISNYEAGNPRSSIAASRRQPRSSRGNRGHPNKPSLYQENINLSINGTRRALSSTRLQNDRIIRNGSRRRSSLDESSDTSRKSSVESKNSSSTTDSHHNNNNYLPHNNDLAELEIPSLFVTSMTLNRRPVTSKMRQTPKYDAIKNSRSVTDLRSLKNERSNDYDDEQMSEERRQGWIDQITKFDDKFLLHNKKEEGQKLEEKPQKGQTFQLHVTIS